MQRKIQPVNSSVRGEAVAVHWLSRTIDKEPGAEFKKAENVLKSGNSIAYPQHATKI